MQKKIQSFFQLQVWPEAHKLLLLVYELTRDFPSEEKFGLTNQMRRAAVSIPSNIAEGFARKTRIDKMHFYIISLGSLVELQSQLLAVKDLRYISKEKFLEVANQTNIVKKLINGSLRKLKE
jgi:four helix bundle protein